MIGPVSLVPNDVAEEWSDEQNVEEGNEDSNYFGVVPSINAGKDGERYVGSRIKFHLWNYFLKMMQDENNDLRTNKHQLTSF